MYPPEFKVERSIPRGFLIVSVRPHALGYVNAMATLREAHHDSKECNIRQGRGVDKDKVYGGNASMEARGLARLVGKE
eukprot:3045007-Amphidinium_carterae.1